MSRCNEHGVYEADETLDLPRAVKGWRGGPIAEIRLADLGTHWIWATGYRLAPDMRAKIEALLCEVPA